MDNEGEDTTSAPGYGENISDSDGEKLRCKKMRRKRARKRRIVSSSEDENSDSDDEEKMCDTIKKDEDLRTLKSKNGQEQKTYDFRSRKRRDLFQKYREKRKNLNKKTNRELGTKKQVTFEEKHDESEPERMENNIEIQRKTKTFRSQYSTKCQFPNCSKIFVCGETNIIGVFFINTKTRVAYGKTFGSNRNFHICASHSDTTMGPDKCNKEPASETSSDYEPNTEDEDFIDDSKGQHSQYIEQEREETEDDTDEDTDEEFEHEMRGIKLGLGRNSLRDLMNKENYCAKLSRPQLEIHTATNPSLHLAHEVRETRNIKTATFDKGLKVIEGGEGGIN